MTHFFGIVNNFYLLGGGFLTGGKQVNNHEYLILSICKTLIFNIVTEFQYIFATYFYREEFTEPENRHSADSVDKGLRQDAKGDKNWTDGVVESHNADGVDN